jgi:hypothetical protein
MAEPRDDSEKAEAMIALNKLKKKCNDLDLELKAFEETITGHRFGAKGPDPAPKL